jgi:hypothetical protein
MFVLTSDITVGPYKRVKPIEVEVSRSMYDFVDRAMFKIPLTAQVLNHGQVITESAQTARLITEGMKVTMLLGYDNKLEQEFEGFVARVNPVTPTEIECEGYSYQLRKKTVLKTFVKSQLIDILKFLVKDTDIVLDENRIPKFLLEKIVFDNHSGTEALNLIRKISDQNISFFFTGKVLYGGLQYLNPKREVKYKIGWNVIRDNQLKLREAKNQDVIIRYLGVAKTGLTTEVLAGKRKSKVVSTSTAGTDGEKKVIRSHNITDQASLQQMANAKLQKLQYDGYEGKITAFLAPFCEPGDTVVLIDEKYPSRGGKYLCEGIVVTYGRNGARRLITLGLKLNG